MILENWAEVAERIQRSQDRAGRRQDAIEVVAVTKNVPVHLIEEAVKAGLARLGESRVQEACEKFAAFSSTKHPLEWHMLGHLQTNKVEKSVEIFDMIQSLDSLRLAQAIDRKAASLKMVQDCLVQVKVSDEGSKTGISPEEAPDFVGQCRSLANLRLRGLMCIPPFFEDASLARPYFAKAYALFQKIFLNGSSEPGKPILSMGMSHDFEVAIEEGSTMVRIGTALFGARPAQMKPAR